MMAWKYTLPAFLVPLMFVLEPSGLALLAKGPLEGILWSTATAMLGLLMLAGGLAGWLLLQTNKLESGLLVVGGLALVYPGWIADAVGVGSGLAALALQWLRMSAGSRLPRLNDTNEQER
jgi:TRAP-type uncharacterized transport system fused permease subunit